MRRGILLAVVALAWSVAIAVERTPTPVCEMDATAMPEVRYSSGEVDGLAIRVESFGPGGVPVSASTTWLPCWWDVRPDVTIPRCALGYAVQRYSDTPTEYAWSAWVAYYQGDRIGEWSQCLDHEDCNGRPCEPGQTDGYMAWPPVCRRDSMPCCGNAACGVLP